MDGESSPVAISKNRKRWLRIFIYSFFVLSCQATATILGRLYYKNGGKSKWMGSLVTIIGFPVLVLFRFFSTITQQPKATTTTNTSFRNLSSFTTIGSVYIGIGLLVSANCYLSSFRLLYLPVSTYSLICASQLVFTAFFSYILNSQKFTPYIVNSLFLLIISSTLFVFNNESQTTKVSKGKYARTAVLANVHNWSWQTWQMYTIGLVGLIFESSSVFSNAITAVGLPIVPILAVVVFHDKMDGTKVISIILAIWGFLSFAYQHYLDEKDLKKNLEGVSNLPLPVSSQDKDDRDKKQQAVNSERSIEIDMIRKSS